MTRLRDPESLKHVVTEMRALLGDAHCAQLINRSTSLVHKACDPDEDFMLPAGQLLALDAACMAQHGHAPFLTFVQSAHERQKHADRPVEDLSVATLDFDAAVGRINALVRQTLDTHSSGGRRITKTEAIRLTEMAHIASAELQDIVRAAKAQNGGNK